MLNDTQEHTKKMKTNVITYILRYWCVIHTTCGEARLYRQRSFVFRNI